MHEKSSKNYQADLPTLKTALAQGVSSWTWLAGGCSVVLWCPTFGQALVFSHHLKSDSGVAGFLVWCSLMALHCGLSNCLFIYQFTFLQPPKAHFSNPRFSISTFLCSIPLSQGCFQPLLWADSAQMEAVHYGHKSISLQQQQTCHQWNRNSPLGERSASPSPAFCLGHSTSSHMPNCLACVPACLAAAWVGKNNFFHPTSPQIKCCLFSIR